MKKNSTPVDKVYKLTRNAAPLTYVLPSKNTRRFPLLYFDEEQNANRPLRYSINQKSPFEDEQDGNAILEPIIFEDGFLSVPKNNPVLQQFLYYHPMNGTVFIEVDNEKDAAAELEKITSEVDALIEARQLTVDQLDIVARVLFGKDTNKMTTAELKRDILVYAKRNPAGFLNVVKDPSLRYQAQVQKFFDNKLLTFKNNKKEVYYNTASNKKKMLSVPYGADPMHVVGSYLQSDEGIDSLKMLEKELE